MVFITRRKADRILRCTTTTLDTVEELYPKKLFMFTKKEMAHLLRYKILIENPYSYFASYKKVTKKEDTYTYTTERINHLAIRIGIVNTLMPTFPTTLYLRKCKPKVSRSVGNLGSGLGLMKNY